jgi:hypothetical protein
MTAMVICLLLIGDTVSKHCLYDNPNLTCGDALLFVAVSPVYGIGMALNFLPLMVGAVLAVLGRAAYRQLPLWYVLAILPACVLAHRTRQRHGFPPTAKCAHSTSVFCSLPPFRWWRC